MNNYKWCGLDWLSPGVQGICQPLNSTCRNVTYTNLTGCPVKNRCNAGANGFIALDGIPSTNINLTNGVMNTSGGPVSFSVTAPSGLPCMLIFENT